ncbi:MAG: exopolysaccharide biosynthesis polyprenyl glycosylphosphotransferase [Sebaldella sp.]|nr:exopolysaccharide biosynthesis polyprenyl glycosylphosphotransferase [Sebaldella sp.]
MNISGVRKNFTYLFFILNIVVYFFCLILIGDSLGPRNVIIFTFSACLYYIFDLYNMKGSKYKNSDILLAVFLNLFLFLLSLFAKLFTFNQGIILFGIILFFQILFKYIVLSVFVDKLKVMFIGKNSYQDELMETLKKGEQYRFLGVYDHEKNSFVEEFKTEYERLKPDVIVDFTDNLLSDAKMVEILLNYKLEGMQYYNYLNFYENLEMKLPVGDLDQKWFLENDGFEIYYNNFNMRIKRLIDIVMSVVISICCLPIMLIAALIVKLESRGPILFVQERTGELNKPFDIYKFRSMAQDAEKDGPQWAQKNDNRITRFGKFMRITRVDELPQLWNVVRGDMSFVGPRPEREFFIKQLEKEIPYYNLRHTVKPGLTGWAQVMYPYGASVDDSYKKLQYDLYYIKHHNIVFDFMITLKTITTVIFGKGR